MIIAIIPIIGKSLLLKEGSIREAQAMDGKLNNSENNQEQEDAVKGKLWQNSLYCMNYF